MSCRLTITTNRIAQGTLWRRDKARDRSTMLPLHRFLRIAANAQDTSLSQNVSANAQDTSLSQNVSANAQDISLSQNVSANAQDTSLSQKIGRASCRERV